jgi:hypothetical protein
MTSTPEPSFYDSLIASYRNPHEQKTSLSRYGYERDDALSDHNQQAYYNKTTKKLLYNVTGTHNLKDWGTNAYLAAGKIKDTNRYKSADSGLKAAKAKYGVDSATVYGHSLGGTIGGYISSKNDNVLTLDKGATIGQKVRSNEKAFGTAFDPVSLLNANSKHMTTFPNENKKITTGLLPVDAVINGIRAHDVDSVKKQGVRFV